MAKLSFHPIRRLENYDFKFENCNNLRITVGRRGHADMLTEESTEISDILNATLNGDFTDRKGCRKKKILCLGKTRHENVLGGPVSGNGLYLSIELGSAYAHY